MTYNCWYAIKPSKTKNLLDLRIQAKLSYEKDFVNCKTSHLCLYGLFTSMPCGEAKILQWTEIKRLLLEFKRTETRSRFTSRRTGKEKGLYGLWDYHISNGQAHQIQGRELFISSLHMHILIHMFFYSDLS